MEEQKASCGVSNTLLVLLLIPEPPPDLCGAAVFGCCLRPLTSNHSIKAEDSAFSRSVLHRQLPSIRSLRMSLHIAPKQRFEI